MLRTGRSLRSYNDLAGRNGSGYCGGANMPRDMGSARAVGEGIYDGWLEHGCSVITDHVRGVTWGKRVPRE